MKVGLDCEADIGRFVDCLIRKEKGAFLIDPLKEKVSALALRASQREVGSRMEVVEMERPLDRLAAA